MNVTYIRVVFMFSFEMLIINNLPGISLNMDYLESERKNTGDYKRRDTNSYIRVKSHCLDERIIQLVNEVQQGMEVGLAPYLTMDGTGGTYLLRDIHRRVRGIFKPVDEEAYGPKNPRGYVGRMGSKGIRSGVLSGEAAYREVAAYLLDHESFANVPITTLAESQHENFCYGLNLGVSKAYPKIGSLQAYIENIGSCDNFSPSLFPKQEVQKIAILDIRILNMDRNEANILVLPGYQLVPIDHGLSIPDTIDISEYDVCWRNWPQCKEPLTSASLTYIRQIDPLQDILKLKSIMSFRDSCLKNIRIATTFLKKSAEAGLTLHQIGSMLYRKGYNETPSILEIVVSKAQELHFAVQQSLSERLKLQKWLCDYKLKEVRDVKELRDHKDNKDFKRPRLFSENELDYLSTGSSMISSPISKGSAKFVETDSSETNSEVFYAISELSEEEEEMVIQANLFIKRRSLSLPGLSSPPKRKSKHNGKDEAFDNNLFYYIEAFMEQAIQYKLKESKSNPYAGHEFIEGRPRSFSEAVL
jgi:hypothetical protein